jgi:hypothetical protein
MRLTNGMKVIAPKGCCHYLTEGKEYSAFDVREIEKPLYFSFKIVNDNGTILSSILKTCSHLNYGNWIIKQETKTPRNLTTTTVKYKNIEFTVSGVWSGRYDESTNEKPEFELHTIEIGDNDLTELLSEDATQGIIDEVLNR